MIHKPEIRKKILNMILPITIENVLQMTAGLVSSGMIGRIDAVAVDSLGISTRITQVIWALFKGIATGTSVFVAQAYGAGDENKLKSVSRQALISAVALVSVFAVLIYWQAGALLGIFNPSSSIMDNSVVYLRIVVWGLPFWVIMLMVAGILQGMGNTGTPMKIAMIMNFVNIVLSYIFIFGKIGISPMGLSGAAVGLVIAQFTGAMFGLYVLFYKNGVLHRTGSGGFFKLDRRQIISIYRVGLPSSMESVFWQLSAIILTKIMLTFGETAFAAYQLGLQAESISYMPALGFGVAATTFIGQSLGARDKEAGKSYLKELIIEALAVTLICSGPLVFLPKQTMSLLTNNMDMINLGAIYLFIMGLVQIPQNISGVLNGALRGAGYTKVPMIVAGTGLWGIRIPASWVLTCHLHLNIASIWAVMGVDLIFRFIFSIILYKRKNIYENDLVFNRSGN